jgi:hypothetical protein
MYDEQKIRKLKLSDINASSYSDHNISRIKLLESGETIDFPFFSPVDTPGNFVFDHQVHFPRKC